MPGGEVAARLAEHDDPSPGHVLAAVVADALDDGVHAGVADAEALAGEAAEERLAAGRAVKNGVADDHVLLRDEGGALRRADRHHATGHALARVVVGVAPERQRHARSQPRTEALARGAVQRDIDRVLRQALFAVAAGDLARQDPADRAVLVLAVDLDPHPLAALERRLGLADDLVVEVVVEHRILRPDAPARPLGRAVGLRQQVGEVDTARLPVVDRLLRLEHVGAADHVLELREAHLRHVAPDLLGHEEEEVDDLLRLAIELLDQRPGPAWRCRPGTCSGDRRAS